MGILGGPLQTSGYSRARDVRPARESPFWHLRMRIWRWSIRVWRANGIRRRMTNFDRRMSGRARTEKCGGIASKGMNGRPRWPAGLQVPVALTATDALLRKKTIWRVPTRNCWRSGIAIETRILIPQNLHRMQTGRSGGVVSRGIAGKRLFTTGQRTDRAVRRVRELPTGNIPLRTLRLSREGKAEHACL